MRSSVGAFAVAVGDPSATRTVYTTVVILLSLGVGLIGLAWWLYRVTRPDLELLAPLEAMETKSWRRRDPATQLRLLDAERPAGANPLHAAPQRPEVVSDFAVVRPVTSFDDLSGDEESVDDGVDPAPDSEAPEEVDAAPEQGGPADTALPALDDAGNASDASAAQAPAVAGDDVIEPDQPGAAFTGEDTAAVHVGSGVVELADDAPSDETLPSARPDDPGIPERLGDAVDPDASLVDAKSIVAAGADGSDDDVASPEPDADDETVEFDRPSAVAHDALMIALGRDTSTVEVVRVDAQTDGDADGNGSDGGNAPQMDADDDADDDSADDADVESDDRAPEASGIPRSTID